MRYNEDMTNLINFTVSLTAASDSVRRGGGGGVGGVQVGGGFRGWEWWAAWSVRLLTALIATTHSLYVIKAKSGTVGGIFWSRCFCFSIKKKKKKSLSSALRCCTLGVGSGPLLFVTPVVLTQAGRSNVSPSPAPS